MACRVGEMPEHGPLHIFLLLRARIAEALRADGLKVRPNLSSLALAIGTFAPSEIMEGFPISDYPFIGARYVSLRDGHVYIVAGPTDDGLQVMAYRLGWWRSNLSVRGGIAVGITEDAWMDSVMVMFSLTHAGFQLSGVGELAGVFDDAATRRSYPVKKLHAYLAHLWRREVRRLGRLKAKALQVMGRSGNGNDR